MSQCWRGTSRDPGGSVELARCCSRHSSLERVGRLAGAAAAAVRWMQWDEVVLAGGEGAVSRLCKGGSLCSVAGMQPQGVRGVWRERGSERRGTGCKAATGRSGGALSSSAGARIGEPRGSEVSTPTRLLFLLLLLGAEAGEGTRWRAADDWQRPTVCRTRVVRDWEWWLEAPPAAARTNSRPFGGPGATGRAVQEEDYG